MSADDERLLRRAYAAFNARDLDAASALIAARRRLANAIDGGRLHGRDAVRRYWTRQFATIDPRVTPVAFEALADGGLAVEVDQVVRSPDGELLSEGRVRHVYTHRDRLVAHLEIVSP